MTPAEADETNHDRQIPLCGRLKSWLQSQPGHATASRALDYKIFEPELRPPTDSLEANAAPPLHTPVPFNELPPRRKVVWIWICMRKHRCESAYAQGAMPPVTVDYFERATNTTLEQNRRPRSDEWKKKFVQNARIVPSAETKPYIDTLREGLEAEVDEIEVFIKIYPIYPSSRRLERQLLYIKDFCASGQWILERSIPIPEDPQRFLLMGVQEPVAWVSDRNWVPESLTNPSKCYEKVLNITELYEVLQKKDWWGGGGFAIFFNLPFFSISTRGQQDIRTLFDGKRHLRRRYDLSFLKFGKNGWHQDVFDIEDQPFLHESVFSLMMTGRSEQYWTAVCFDEDFLNEEPRLDAEEETEHLDGATDPIILQAEFQATDTIASPRAYSLAAFAMALKIIVEHHADIQERFQHSLDRFARDTKHDLAEEIPSEAMYEWKRRFPDTLGKVIHYNSRIVEKLDDFLSQEAIFGPDGLPQGLLWRSLQGESGALESLRTLKLCLYNLRSIDSELRRIAETCEEARRDRKNYHADEQQNITKQIQRYTSVTLVVGILGLAAQLYGSRPQQDDSSSLPQFFALVAASFIICIGVSACLFWAGISQHVSKFCQYLAPLPRYFTKIPRVMRRCLGGLGAHIDAFLDLLGWLWVYVGAVGRG
ncbi:hypothetical protein NM208_g7631 [Fusarium decemcellulare]|uniref:Uncharacterized protein n=1 Tax=Fusarium decemcellulare TaxID=57161 RepID=A0ACC1S8B2_9HYPO|nr:hypothetical protein NM208_g7631 [Fusarium decemcellulare]